MSVEMDFEFAENVPRVGVRVRPRRAAKWAVDGGLALREVPFCVLDIETTGSGADDGITELGAVKVSGGECLGTFQTLVNPGRSVAPFVTMLTGITDVMLVPAPPIEAVLPAFFEFARGCVVVGHNVRFDLGFLDAAADRLAYPRLLPPAIDTLALARRIVREDVLDCRLGTLAEQLRLDHRPTHRAFDDALATADLLHHLIERAAAWDVRSLDDLVALPRLAGNPYAAKLRLTTALPRAPGIYRFVGPENEVLYVGTATNLRSRVRSYFGSDDRRMIQPLLRTTRRIDHVAVEHPLIANVLEVRELHRLRPRFNRRGARPQRAAYVQLTTNEPFPRLKVVRGVRGSGLHLGPLPSSASATRVVEAIQQVVPLRRCTAPLRNGRPVRDSPCLPAQLGVAPCPCAGIVDRASYDAAVAGAASVLGGNEVAAASALTARIERLSAQRRYEEAALTRDRLSALAAAVERRNAIAELRRLGRWALELGGGLTVTVDDGRLVGVDRLGEPPVASSADHVTPAHADEAMVIWRWTRRAARTKERAA
jgi:DNA polymerase-3 subunit epsilon